MHEKEPAIGEIEGRAGDLLDRERIGFDDVEGRAALGAKIGERLGAKRAVDVDAGDAAVWPDPIGHQPHRHARTRADIEAAHPGFKPDAVENVLGRASPHECLLAEALILGGIPCRRMAVRVQFLRARHHRARLLLCPRSR